MARWAARNLLGARSSNSSAHVVVRVKLLLAHMRVRRSAARAVSVAAMRAKAVARADGHQVRLHFVVHVEHLTDGLAVYVAALARFGELVPSAPLRVLNKKVVAGTFFEQPSAELQTILLDGSLELVQQRRLINTITVNLVADSSRVQTKIVDALSGPLLKFLNVVDLSLIPRNLLFDVVELAADEAKLGSHIADGDG